MWQNLCLRDRNDKRDAPLEILKKYMEGQGEKTE